MTERPFLLIAAKVDAWNQELTPWKAPAVYGTEEFGDGAAQTLEEIKRSCVQTKVKPIISEAILLRGFSRCGRLTRRICLQVWQQLRPRLVSGLYPLYERA